MQKNNHITSQNCQRITDETALSFDPRYLAAKKSIDDRALNHHVWETLRQTLPRITGNKPLHILEIGSGIGTMFERIIDSGLLTGPATYLATDNDPGQLRAAQEYLSQWAKQRNQTFSWADEHHGRLSTENAEISITLQQTRAEELAERAESLGPYHLIIAHAVLDLIDFPVVLPQILSGLAHNGLTYFTCNFDGETVFLPECAADKEIVNRYHASMESRLTGASHTGRRLLTFLQGPGFEILAAGSSDWVIHPRGQGYSSDESFFLHAIIETVAKELSKTAQPRNAPEELSNFPNIDNLANWAHLRHRQVENGELSFLARHLDLLVQCQLAD